MGPMYARVSLISAVSLLDHCSELVTSVRTMKTYVAVSGASNHPSRT